MRYGKSDAMAINVRPKKMKWKAQSNSEFRNNALALRRDENFPELYRHVVRGKFGRIWRRSWVQDHQRLRHPGSDAINIGGKLVRPDGEKLIAAAPLEEQLMVRSTSETIMWEAFSRLLQLHRDLQLPINQWANAARMEVGLRLFLRTVEFLWRAVHTPTVASKMRSRRNTACAGTLSRFLRRAHVFAGNVRPQNHVWAIPLSVRRLCR
ncbi:MAG: hypothetical protein LBI39_02960 [Puniceicoccales bacterium]|jgi:hypothetical protein|nr:hypothetical protein [Puniceicoccales bacterium]